VTKTVKAYAAFLPELRQLLSAKDLATLPFVFQHFKIDPATATGPLITTTTDLISTSAYLALATTILL